jgi:hypothetical protein
MRAQKKPVIIDYHIFDGNIDNVAEFAKSFKEKFNDHFTFKEGKEGLELYVKTLEGTSYNVPKGYVIIRGVKGEYYPCDPAIFEETYVKFLG